MPGISQEALGDLNNSFRRSLVQEDLIFLSVLLVVPSFSFPLCLRIFSQLYVHTK